MGRRTIWWKRRMRAFASNVPAPVSSEITATSARLTWTTILNAVSYDLERGSSDSTEWTSVYTTPSDLTHVDEGLAAGADYLYRLGVVNAAGERSYSPSMLVTTHVNSEPPVAPEFGPGVVGKGTTSIDLVMAAVPTATRYILQRTKKV